jgi:maleylacetoacetate isomerase
MSEIELYSYWRSSSSWRVRLALHYKDIKFEYKAVNLLKSEQLGEAYLQVNPQGFVPALQVDSVLLTESFSILEYLEETRPEKPILPKDPKERALVRRIAQMIVADIQPVQNLKVLKYVGMDRKLEWGSHFITEGFKPLEKVLAQSAGKFCFGDMVTMADFCLIPQIYNARRFKVDMEQFPTIVRIGENFDQLDFAKAAHPNAQPDCDPDAAK